MTTKNRCNSFEPSTMEMLNDKSKYQMRETATNRFSVPKGCIPHVPYPFLVVCDKLKIDSWKRINNNKRRGKKPYTLEHSPPAAHQPAEMRPHKSWASRIFSTIWASTFAVHMNSGTQHCTFQEKPEHTHTHTQQMAGYEILFSMVVCLLFAFGFASLRAVRALFCQGYFFGLYTYIYILIIILRFVSLTVCLHLHFFYSFSRLQWFFSLIFLSRSLMLSTYMSPFFSGLFFFCCLLLSHRHRRCSSCLQRQRSFRYTRICMYKRHKGTTKQ